MVVCRFYQQGNCRYGDNCRNEHPGVQNNRNTGFASQNRFAAFQSPAGGTNKAVRKDVPWSINEVDVRNDLTADKNRPQWILSTYGPGKNSPASLLDGNELSFEELRLRFYELKAAGNEAQATNEANDLWSKAEQQITGILNNVDKVTLFMQEAQKNHPNRYDFLKMTGTTSKEQIIKEAQSTSPFGGGSTFGAKLSGFGAPTTGFGTGFGGTSAPASDLDTSMASGTPTGAFGQSAQPSGFGTPSFGKPSQPGFGQSAFGQPSTTAPFGKPGGGAFGQPSTLGPSSQFGTSGLGQPAAKNPFAAPSAATFGQPTKPASIFGQPLQPAAGFGQPSKLGGFGQPSQPSVGFGQPSQLGGGFGQPSKPAGAFGQPSQPISGFGQSSQPAPSFGGGSSPFGGFGQPSKPAAGFGQPSQAAAGFGQPSQPTSAFGQPSKLTSGLGQPAQPASSFGQPAQQKTTNLAVPGFGQPNPTQATDTKPSNPFGDTSSTTTNNPFGQPSQPPTTNPSNPFLRTASSTDTTLINNPSSPPSTRAPQSTTVNTPHPLFPNKRPAAVHYTQTLPPPPASQPLTTINPQTTLLTSYKSRPVKYINDAPCYDRPDGRGWERIWFPDLSKAAEVRVEDVVPNDAVYEDEGVREAYRVLAEKGRWDFENGGMPRVPPRREWVGFDF